MNGHVGLYAGMGKGVLMSSLNRMALNTPDSIETEVVGVGQKLLKFIWFCYFCKE